MFVSTNTGEIHTSLFGCRSSRVGFIFFNAGHVLSVFCKIYLLCKVLVYPGNCACVPKLANSAMSLTVKYIYYIEYFV